MDFPHGHRDSETHGHSPGNGITPMVLSAGPLATEGEATPGPDDYNPYDDPDNQAFAGHRANKTPTDGSDPFVFDDVDRIVDDVRLPGHNFFE